LCRISGGRLGAEMPLKIGEPRRRQARERCNAICGEKVPVPRLPRGAQPFIAREAELQQRHECGRKNEKAHNFAVTRNQRVALQEQFADGERPRNNLAKEKHTTAAVEDGVDGVIGDAIRSKTQRWRRINWVDGGSRTQLATSDDRGCECGCNGNMQAHTWTQLQQARNDSETFTREIRS
jgi:hypothetical protein